MSKKFLIIDGSSGLTGALKSALYTAEAVGEKGVVLFAVPNNGAASEIVRKEGYDSLSMRFPRIKKNIFELCFFLPFLFLSAIKVKRFLKERNISVVIVNDYDLLIGFAVKLLGWDGDVFTFVRRVPASQNKFLSWFWLKAAYHHSVYVVAVSKAVLSQLPLSGKSKLIYNCIHGRRREPMICSSDDEEFRFSCPANYMSGKGQMDVLKAFERAIQSNENIRLSFYGGDLGLKKNHRFRCELEEFVTLHGLNDFVDINGFDSSLENVFGDAHAVLSCGYSESFSRVCVEAGLFSLPVIATKCGGPEEIIVDGRTGSLVDVGDVDAIAREMLFYVNNRGLARTYGHNARLRVEDLFSYSRFKFSVHTLLNL